MDVIEFGLYLKDLRKKVGLSTHKLAELSDVSQSYISHLESGRKKSVPSPEILSKLADPLGVPYTDLMIKAGYYREATQYDIDAFFGRAKSYKNILEQTHLKNELNGQELEFLNVVDAIKAYLSKVDLVGNDSESKYKQFSEKLDRIGINPTTYEELRSTIFDSNSSENKPLFTSLEDALIIDKLLQTIQTISNYKGEVYRLEDDLKSQNEIMSDLLSYLLWGKFKYNTNELTKEDKSRIINMLELMFPEG